jgi:hypothetical protein
MQTPAKKDPRGRKSKGPRRQTPVYLPVDLWEEAQVICERDGLPMTDVITRLVAQALGKPAPAYCFPKPQLQEELPLSQQPAVVAVHRRAS